ncbi:hypothetical protein RRF57_000283 [Xylaria bambusicola]|uniref:Uncharacterized protein n=1 Tax=Xylaria bambusicola TaxID=326684 RepID=A0AAN7UBV8_9PEZI
MSANQFHVLHAVRAKERNAPLRFGELRQNDMIRLAAPHPGAFGNILNKVENLKIKKDAQPEQPIGVAQHAGHVAPNQPQQIAQIQVAADPFVAFHFPWNIPPQPIPGVGHVLGDRVNASANQVEAPQPKRLTNLNLLEPPDDPLYAYAFGRLNP